jgi:hypothetical protein
MPYIKKEDREQFNVEVTALARKLYMAAYKPGDLNYCISSIVWSLFDASPSYTKANELIGVLECVKQEFIRRRLNAYEDEKIAQNGDL